MLRTMEQKYSRRIGSAVMEELGLNASQIDELQKVPYDKLLAAGEKAVAKMRVEADKEGVASFIFGWAPTVDGRWCCQHSLSTLRLRCKARTFR